MILSDTINVYNKCVGCRTVVIMILITLSLFFTSLFSTEVWTDVKTQAPGLFSGLVDACLRGKEKSTSKNYSLAFKTFSKWCETFNFSSLPASQTTVALYLVHVTNNSRSCSRSKLNSIFYAINWAHVISNSINPCNNDWLKLCLQGCKTS